MVVAMTMFFVLSLRQSHFRIQQVHLLDVEEWLATFGPRLPTWSSSPPEASSYSVQIHHRHLSTTQSES